MNRYNNVLPKGTIVMAHALEENHHMLDCNLEGNCIGEAGGKALLRAMRMAAEKKRQLRINFKNCNLHYSEPDLFNRYEPKMGSHSFHLDDPYDYMKARVLFEVYNNSFGALWKDVKHRELIVTGGPDDPNLEEGTLLIGDMRMTYIYTCIHIYIYDGSPTPLILTFSTASSFFQRHSFHPTSSLRQKTQATKDQSWFLDQNRAKATSSRRYMKFVDSSVVSIVVMVHYYWCIRKP